MKYQAFAWDVYPSGGVKGEARIFNSLEEANDWLKYQPQPNRMAVELNKAPNMWELVQGNQ